MGVEIPIGYGLASVKFLCSGVTDLMVTTFGYEHLNDDGPEPKPDDNALLIWSALSSTDPEVGVCSPSVVSTSYTMLGVDVVEMHASGQHIGTSSVNVAGTFSAQSPPPNCALLVRKSTTLGGRRGRGRFFFPPIHLHETDVTAAGVIASGQITALQTRFTELLVRLTDRELPMVLLHGGALPGLPSPTAVTGLSVDARLATQRRRMR